jgi:hypothetical protein
MAGWKSEKDREAFIAKMQEAGFDQADIDADVEAIDAQKSLPVAAPPPALKPSSEAGGGGSPMTQPEVAAPSMTAAPAQSVQADLTSMKQAREDQGNSLTDQIFNVENAQLLGIPLAAYGGYKLADKALEKSGLKARIFGQPTPIDRTVDVPLEVTPDNKLSQAAQQPKISAQEQAMIDRSEVNRLAKERDAAARALAAGPAPTPEIPGFLRNQPPAGAVAPVTPAPAVPAPVAPQAPAPVAAPTPVAETPKATKPVEPPKVSVEPDTEKLTKEQKSMKNYLVAQYGGGVEGEAAYGKVKEILGSTPEFPKGQGGGLTAEQNKVIKDWRKANIEGPKVNLTKDMKKAFKGGGGLAVLAAIPGFAEAAQNRDFGKMTDIATDFLVLPFAESRQLNEGEEQELAKRRYEGMVGSGRGIAPPSMYRR